MALQRAGVDLNAFVQQQIDAALAQHKEATTQRRRLDQKLKASNASLSGPPFGVTSAPTAKRYGTGHFSDVAADVAAAVNALGL
jgi:hypothetical protein